MSYREDYWKNKSPYRKEIKKLERKEDIWVRKEIDKLQNKCKHEDKQDESAGPVSWVQCRSCGKMWDY